jgi:alpha-glucosidase
MHAMSTDAARPWWHGVLYHVYLRSFADSDGDGVGDLRGLIARLDHLAWLGVDGVWVSPVMPSPNEDWGYDIADYCGVDPAYGTLDDVDELVAQAGARGMRVVFDLVPNHSSDRHPWFVASRSSRDDPKRDWYIWRDPKPDGSTPNNWVSSFFGPAWQLDEATGQYYLHSFLEAQADLNWWNEGVREAFDDVLRFWFDRGVAGFRIDVVHKMLKDPQLRDNPPATGSDSFIERVWGQRELHNADHPQNHDIMRRWRGIADAYPEPKVLIGETYLFDLARMAAYHGAGDELHLNFNMPFLWTPFEAPAIRAVVQETLAALPEGAQPVWNGGSHDITRFPTRWCGGDPRKVRTALMMLLTLPGTKLLYYGDEIGMTDGTVAEEASRDPLGRRAPVRSAGRDPARTPMQWSAGPGAGFTDPGVEPWLPLGDASVCNVEAQRSDPGSVLSFCHDLIALRREMRDLRAGAMRFLDAPDGVLGWRRGERTTVALNLSDVAATVETAGGVVRAGTRREREGERVERRLALEPWEASSSTSSCARRPDTFRRRRPRRTRAPRRRSALEHPCIASRTSAPGPPSNR